MENSVNHPAHYGGKDNVYEAIKVIEAHGLGFSLGNAVKYILRAGKKGDAVEDLMKAAFYINREIDRLSVKQPRPAEKMETPTDGLKIKEGDSGPLTPQQIVNEFKKSGIHFSPSHTEIMCRQTRGWTRLVEDDPSTYPAPYHAVAWIYEHKDGGRILLQNGDPNPKGYRRTHWIYLPK